MKIVCQDMFFSRSRTTPTAGGLLGANTLGGRAALESALRVNRSNEEKANVVAEMLDIKINGSAAEQQEQVAI